MSIFHSNSSKFKLYYVVGFTEKMKNPLGEVRILTILR